MIIDGQHHCYVKGKLVASAKEQTMWMDSFNIDMAVITNQLASLKTDKVSTYQEYNDKLFEIQREYPDRFVPAPTIPLFSAKSALDEFERVYSNREAKAVFVQPIEWRLDRNDLLPFYEKLDDLRFPIFVHPSQFDLPLDPVYGSSEMGAAVGFMFNTTVAISRLLLSGLLDTCPRLKFIVPHLGGALPFLLGRVETIYNKERFGAARPPLEYLDSFLFDIVCYRKEALDFAVSVLGPDRFVFGTDYGCPGKNMVKPRLMKEFVEGLAVSREAKEKIYGQNLAKLLKIDLLAT
jgi:aminocarboxymuconate-semialdehyde decarboxylase